MKKIPYPLYLAIFLGALGIIAAGLLAGVNILTAPAIKANEEKRLEEQLKVIEVESPSIVKVKLLAGVVGVYEGIYKGTECYVFNTEDTNEYLTVRVLVVIDKVAGKVINLSVGMPATTHGLNDKFIDNKFGVINAGANDFEGKFVYNISNATTSATSVKNCIKVAFEQNKGIKGE